MTDFRPVLFIIGLLLFCLAATMSIPVAVDYFAGHGTWVALARAAMVTCFVGLAMAVAFRTNVMQLNTSQIFALTTFSWLFIATFAALPFYVSTLPLDFTDSFFEAMSGITTTGATLINGLDDLSPGILLWRALLQWLGGIGIVVIAVAILPILKVGGMQIFRSESSDRSEKVMPRVAQVAAGIGLVYVFLTVWCTILLWAEKMPIFDAIVHAMTTISTGGFSTKDASIAFFKNDTIEWIIIFFMCMGAMPFVLYVRLFRGQFAPFFFDTQVKWFFAIVFIFITLIISYRFMFHDYVNTYDVIRGTVFNTISVLTGTGYASEDYATWGNFPIMIFFLLMFIGGCTGSATGGIKVFRVKVMISNVIAQLQRLLRPNAIVMTYYNKKPIPDSIVSSVGIFIFVFMLTFFIVSVMIASFGYDFLTSASVTASALGNVGPGLGAVAGPTGNYASFPNGAKWVLSFAMLLGRLELFTVLVLLVPSFWRR